MIKESWVRKEGCPATEFHFLPPENQDLEAPGSRLRPGGWEGCDNGHIVIALTLCARLCAKYPYYTHFKDEEAEVLGDLPRGIYS